MKETQINFCRMEPDETTIVVDLVLNVFTEYVAPQYSIEGIEEFRKIVNAKAVESWLRAGNSFILAKDRGKLVQGSGSFFTLLTNRKFYK